MVRVAAGNSQSLAVTSTGRLLTWGSGAGGRLGHGNQDDEAVPREVAGAGVVVEIAGGAERSLVTRQGGEVVVFGLGPGKNIMRMRRAMSWTCR